MCTADQVLGLVQNNRRALFAFPSIGNGAFVFDEIHHYDDRLFGALLRFLDAFRGAPTLLMTASLPKQRLQAIQNVLGCLRTTLEIVSGPTDLEQIKRYALSGLLSGPPWALVQQTLNEKGKVLWVANTVDRAVSFAKKASGQGLAPVLLYHSRYRYCDRIEKHASVVNAFKNSGPVLAITTQVCEVSLDLSADLLVTDLAPIPALIQRLGRLNRRVTSEAPGVPRPAFFLEPDSPLPYESSDLETARKWLFTLRYGSFSQADLAGAFERNIQDAKVVRIESAWLDGGPFSKPAPLREAGVTISIIRAEDERACLDKNRRPITKEIIRHAIPMTLGPVACEISGWKQLGFVFVASAGRVDYSKEWGARWA
ncbi:MAG: CRISPR-associated helicase Cas3' [Gammaproteobacteria bacterium]